MDDARVGRSLHVLRTRRGLRQVDVARAAGLSQGAISLIERGHLRTLSIQTVRAAFAAVDAGFEGHVMWRGGELDRVLDELHAQLVGAAAALLEASGWSVSAEVTFSRYGERGSIDLVATQRQLSVAVVIEAKTRLLSIEETLRRLDAKVRLAPAVVYEREGWRPSVLGRLLVVAGTSTQRRQVSRHDDVLRVALPERNRAVRGWLRAPAGSMHGLMFLSPTNPGSTRAPRGRSAASRRPKTESRSAVIAR